MKKPHRKWLSAILAIVCLFAWIPPVSADEPPADPFIPPIPLPTVNKVTNPDLESGSKELGWAWGWGTYDVVNHDQYSGSYSIKVAKNASAEQDVKNLKPDTTYILRAMVKSQTASDVVRLGVKNYGGTQVQVVSANSQYRQRMVAFTTGPSSTQAKIFLYRDTTGSGAAYGDDFAVVEAATGVAVTSEGDANTVETGKMLQMQADVQPESLEYKEVAWSVEETTGSAVISGEGVLRGISAGEVIVKAAAKDGSNKQSTVTIAVYGETVPIDNGQTPDDPPPLENSNPLEHVKDEWKGIVWDPYNANPESAQAIEDAEAIAAAGIKWARIWLSGSKALSGDWNYFDKFIALCKENGIQLVATWNKTNPWNDLGDEAQQQEQVNLLKEAVQRYGDDIRYWEIHNEPNLLNYWNADPNRWDSENNMERGRGSDDPNSVYNQAVHRYVQWLQLAHDAIKEVDPTVTVILGGLSEWIMEDFMDRLTLEQAYLYFDEVAFHPYAENSNPVPEKTIERLNSFKEKMTHWPAPHNDKPIWITEIGFHVSDIGTSPPGSIPNDVNGRLDEATKAYYLQKTMQLLIQNLEEPRPIFYYIYHEKDSTKSGFGLIKRASGGGAVTYLPAYDTYASMDEDWDYYETAALPDAPPAPEPDAPPPVEPFVEPVPMPVGNKFVNPDLETGSKSGWSGWGTTAVVNNNQYSGSHSIKVNANAAAEQVVKNLTPNTKYILRAMVKSDTYYDPVRLGVTDYGGPQVQSTSAYPEYRQRMVSFTTGTNHTQAKIFLYRDTTGSGNAYGDDFVVIEAATGIIVTGVGGATGVAKGQTLQMQADVQPASLEYRAVDWAVETITGNAAIDENGLLTGVSAGQVTVKAAAKDGSNVQSTVTVSVYEPLVPDEEQDSDESEPVASVPVNEGAGDGEAGTKIIVIDINDLAAAISGSVNRTVVIQVKPTGDASGITVKLPAEQLREEVGKQFDNFVIDAGFAKIIVPQKVLAEHIGASSRTMELSVTKTDASILSEAVRGQIGNGIAYDFSLTIDGIRAGSLGNTGKDTFITIAFDYALNQGEAPGQVVVYSITGDGELEIVKNGRYDPKFGKVVFKATHSGTYAAAYRNISVDLAADWAKDSMQALAARGMIKPNQYKPEQSVTRVEFIAFLMNGLDLVDDNAVGTFADVAEESEFYNAVATAQQLGIATGYSKEQFNPDEIISRQDMAVLTYRALSAANLKLSSLQQNEAFADASAVADYAQQSVAALQNAGIMVGTDGNTFDPEGTASFAQASVVVYKIFNLDNQ